MGGPGSGRKKGPRNSKNNSVYKDQLQLIKKAKNRKGSKIEMPKLSNSPAKSMSWGTDLPPLASSGRYGKKK